MQTTESRGPDPSLNDLNGTGVGSEPLIIAVNNLIVGEILPSTSNGEGVGSETLRIARRRGEAKWDGAARARPARCLAATREQETDWSNTHPNGQQGGAQGCVGLQMVSALSEGARRRRGRP